MFDVNTYIKQHMKNVMGNRPATGPSGNFILQVYPFNEYNN